MYPIRLGFPTAQDRMRRLVQNGHYSEALVAITATSEKTFRRVLKQLIVSAGFESKQAGKLLSKFRGLTGVKEVWPRFDPLRRGLPEVIGNQNWQPINDARSERNALVHGERVIGKRKARRMSEKAITALAEARRRLEETYGYDGWSRVAVRRRSRLHEDPKVTIR